MLLKSTQCLQGTIPGDLRVFSPHSFHRMKLELLPNKIFRAARSDVVLKIQVGAQDLTVPSSEAWLYLGRSSGGQVDAPHASAGFFGSSSSGQKL